MRIFILTIVLLCSALLASAQQQPGGSGSLPPSTSSGGGGTVTSVTLAGTSNQIAVTGTCTITTTGTCTLSLPSGLVLPGTIDGLTITIRCTPGQTQPRS